MDAVVSGTLSFDGDCLHLIESDLAYPVVWPSGASWDPVAPSVMLGGRAIEPGMALSGSGGYVYRAHVEQQAGSEVADAADRCAGPTGEIAFFNADAEVNILAE